MILLIDNYDSFTYNLYQLIASIKDEVKVLRNDQITLNEIEGINPKGIILSPGPGRPEDAGIIIDLISNFYTKIPILGVCLGHQAIGIAFGGEVIKADEIIHGKSTNIFHDRKRIFNGVSLPFSAARYHSLIIRKETLPQNLVITSENEDGMIMGVRHALYPVYGIQFHPESILTPEGSTIIKNFLMECGIC